MDNTWVEDFVNLLKTCEKIERSSGSKRANTFREFHRSFQSGSKQFRVKPQLDKIYQQVKPQLPEYIFQGEEVEVEEGEEGEEDKKVEVEKVKKGEDDIQDVSGDSSDDEDDIQAMTSDVPTEEKEETDEEKKIRELKEKMEKEVEMQIKKAQAESDLSGWVLWFNKKGFRIQSGNKAIKLQVSKVTVDLRLHLVRLFWTLDPTIQDIPLPAQNTAGVSQKKIKRALKQMKGMDKQKLKQMKNNIPQGELEQMANDSQMRELAASLESNPQASNLAAKLK